MVLPDERKFTTFRRGKIRDDIILAKIRNTLRSLVNPDTGSYFTELEIAVITQEDSRFYIEADAIDLYGQAIQQRAIWFAEQVRPDRAASGWLRNVHGELWLPDGLLEATGGSGIVRATGSPGTIYVGSTVIGDPSAAIARDPSGKRYQVLVTNTANSSGQTFLQMQAVDPGDNTNLLVNTVLTWVSPPLGTDPEANVYNTFSGGFNAETENEFAQRIVRRIRYKPGAGNSAMFAQWAEQASNAVKVAFVYATALHAGSVIVAIAQKRGTTVGPTALVPSIGTVAAVTAQLAPPVSPNVPHNVHVLVTPINAEPTNLVLKLAMPRGIASGWTDADPWPKHSVAFNDGVKLTTITSQTLVTFQTDIPPEYIPVGTTVYNSDCPSLAVWNSAISDFEELDVYSLYHSATNVYVLVLDSPPVKTLVSGDVISPANNRSATIVEAMQSHFDELGPSELVANTDTRFVRAARFPRPDQEYPTRAGQSIISTIDEFLGGALSDAELAYVSKTSPTTPAEHLIVAGPNQLVLGTVGIYSFE